MSYTLRFRQIHLDFHTSGHIPGIGSSFHKKSYQETLKKACVNSVTTFATCHHGWSYYKTSVGHMHPELKFDLLRAQYDACREIDINVPIYLTAGVNNWAARNHPEWREVNSDGKYAGWVSPVTEAGFHTMCFNSPYLELLCSQIQEVVQLFPDCNGIFLDIICQSPCCCRWCLEDMHSAGLDARSEADRNIQSRKSLLKYYEQTTAAARSQSPDMPVFHNSGHVIKGDTDILKFFSHLELESLPTGGWGYDHYPSSAAYVRGLGLDFLGMTGKFHTTWGEFGGYKHPNALRYECAAMLALGSKCSIGDQLHPGGTLDESTYRLIGSAYREVELKEPWCTDVTAVSDIALLSSSACSAGQKRESAADDGASRVLLEGHLLFDICDKKFNPENYKLVILPDDVNVDPELEKKLNIFLQHGGRLLLTGTSGIRPEGGFNFDTGAVDCGQSPFEPDYVLPEPNMRGEMLDSPLVMYMNSRRIRIKDGAPLGQIYEPYFNRDYRHFSSHQHTPCRENPSEYPAGVRKGSIIYLAHPVFSIYRYLGAPAYREYALGAIRSLLAEKQSAVTDLPSSARLTLMHQTGMRRYIVHLLSAHLQKRGGPVKDMKGTIVMQHITDVEIIEELPVMYNTVITLRLSEKIKKVTLEPQGKPLAFETQNGGLKMTVPEFTCHQMVVLEY